MPSEKEGSCLPKDSSETAPLAAQLLVGGFAGILSDVATHPLHTVWTWQQELSVGNTFELKKMPAWMCAQMYAERSVDMHSTRSLSLYKGFSIAALTSVPGAMLYLFGMQLSIELFNDNHVGRLMQGPMARAFGMILCEPATRLIELEQASMNSGGDRAFKNLSVTGKCRFIWKKSGVRGFYRGALPQFCSNSFTDAIGFWLRAQVLECYPESQRKNAAPQFLSTIFGFGFANVVTTPISVIETRLRINEANSEQFPDTKFLPAWKRLYATRGVRGFFTGLPVATTYGVLASLVIPSATVGAEYLATTQSR